MNSTWYNLETLELYCACPHSTRSSGYYDISFARISLSYSGNNLTSRLIVCWQQAVSTTYCETCEWKIGKVNEYNLSRKKERVEIRKITKQKNIKAEKVGRKEGGRKEGRKGGGREGGRQEGITGREGGRKGGREGDFQIIALRLSVINGMEEEISVSKTQCTLKLNMNLIKYRKEFNWWEKLFVLSGAVYSFFGN